MKTDPVVARYQQAFAEWLGVGHAFAFWKGRVAWYAILRALGVGEGDEVILPGYTCVMDVNPVMYVGARPVYVDIEPVTYNLDPDLIEPAITERTKGDRRSAHLRVPVRDGPDHGHRLRPITSPWWRTAVWLWARAIAAGGWAPSVRPPTGRRRWNKPYTTGIGGMTTTDDPELARRIEQIMAAELVAPSAKEVLMLRAQLAVYKAVVYPRSTALVQEVFRRLTRTGLVVGSSDPAEFRPQMADNFFKGASRLQARVGLRQLRRIDQTIAHRRQMAQFYDQLLTEKGWPLPKLPEHLDPVLVRYPLRVADKKAALAKATGKLIELGSWFECPLHPIETPLAAYGYTSGQCPGAELASQQVVNLPVHPRTGPATCRRTVNFVGQIGPARGSLVSADKE